MKLVLSKVEYSISSLVYLYRCHRKEMSKPKLLSSAFVRLSSTAVDRHTCIGQAI